MQDYRSVEATASLREVSEAKDEAIYNLTKGRFKGEIPIMDCHA
ncbi:hypothetical protein [Helicobacter sp.]|nr:hypothetical protein [Helicobacter sp.]